jgi:hypothetical protein
MYEAPGYKGSESSKARPPSSPVVTAASGRRLPCSTREGTDVAIVYLNEHDDAKETKRAVAAVAAQHDASLQVSDVRW